MMFGAPRRSDAYTQAPVEDLKNFGPGRWIPFIPTALWPNERRPHFMIVLNVVDSMVIFAIGTTSANCSMHGPGRLRIHLMKPTFVNAGSLPIQINGMTRYPGIHCLPKSRLKYVVGAAQGDLSPDELMKLRNDAIGYHQVLREEFDFALNRKPVPYDIVFVRDYPEHAKNGDCLKVGVILRVLDDGLFDVALAERGTALRYDLSQPINKLPSGHSFDPEKNRRRLRLPQILDTRGKLVDKHIREIKPRYDDGQTPDGVQA